MEFNRHKKFHVEPKGNSIISVTVKKKISTSTTTSQERKAGDFGMCGMRIFDGYKTSPRGSLEDRRLAQLFY